MEVWYTAASTLSVLIITTMPATVWALFQEMFLWVLSEKRDKQPVKLLKLKDFS